MGTKEDVQDLFQLAVQGRIRSLVEVAPFDKIDSVARKVERGSIAGRVVMRIPQ